MKKEYDFSTLEKAEPKYLKKLKKTVTLRLDQGVVSYFKQLAKKLGMPYQSLINYILNDYACHGLEPINPWEKLKGKK